ncbi:MAG: amidohydrolase family protein, partial [Lachnospiraceae bacterium]|nr:amidohydrolase family protein [Lachnospiraceae bacterium]
MDVLIVNGYVLDPANDRSGYMNVLIRDDSILEVGENVKGNPDKVIDADGCYVMPGLIDMHVHLREPGYTHKETIRTGARAAAKGGFTTICAMPNTKPVTDNPYTVSDIIRQADKEALIHVLVVGAMTREQQGERIADMEGMFDEGIIAVSEDGSSVKNAAVCLEAMKEAARLGLPVLDHCEDKDLAGDGVFNEGVASKKFGVKGIPNCAEDTVAARDIVLAKAAGCDLHLCHVSTKESTLLVYLAKAAGSHVTCEVTPHHFT